MQLLTLSNSKFHVNPYYQGEALHVCFALFDTCIIQWNNFSAVKIKETVGKKIGNAPVEWYN